MRPAPGPGAVFGASASAGRQCPARRISRVQCRVCSLFSALPAARACHWQFD